MSVRIAVREVVAEMDQSYWRRNITFRGAVVDVVEGCQAAGPYAAMRNLFEKLQINRPDKIDKTGQRKRAILQKIADEFDSQLIRE
jgi:hypothetical protein